MRRLWRIAVLLALLGVGVFLAMRATLRWREFRRAENVCEAAEREDWAAATAGRSEPPPTVSGLREADCRCQGLLAAGREAECVAMQEKLLATPAADDWLPRPEVLTAVVEARRIRGDVDGALELARRGADAYPQHIAVLLAEGKMMVVTQGQAAAADAVAARIPDAGPAEIGARLLAATLAGEADDHEQALAALGERPEDPAARDAWYRLRLQSLAKLGQPGLLRATAEEWGRLPDRAAVSLAHYAYLLSITQQQDPLGRHIATLLCTAATTGDQIGDPLLLESVLIRCVGSLSLLGREEEALRFYEQGVERFGRLGNLDRSDLERTAEHRAGEDRQRAGAARLELRVEGAQPGDVLLLSPEPAADRSAPFVPQPLAASGVVVVERAVDSWPLRWVLRDDTGAVRGSGSAWPDPTRTVVVPIRRQPPAAPAAPHDLAQAPAAGAPRLFVVVLDCGDWRFVQHGVARRQLPFFEALLARGRTTVLESNPPLTAVAIRSLAEPGSHGVDGVISLVHQLGAEVAGLSFVTANPAAPLGWVLPQGAGLFATLGSGRLRTANLLHSYGSMQVGKHGQILGPGGAFADAELAAPRPLRPAEAAIFPAAEARVDLVQDLTRDMDDITALARGGQVDLAVLRVAAMDLFTHGQFPQTVAGTQDDGDAILYRAYRYVDLRLGELWSALDANDVLVVMSDHGARTALEHDPAALFIAAGGGVEPGRIAGRPDLRGVPRLIADFFGVATEWPDEGLRLRGAADPAAVPSTAPAAP